MAELNTVSGPAETYDSIADFEEAERKSRSPRQPIMVSLVWIVCTLSALVWVWAVVHIVGWENMWDGSGGGFDTTKIPTDPGWSKKTTKVPAEAVCTTEDCLYMRWLIEASVNREKDPCQNFYQYVCSGILDKHPSWFAQNREGVLGVVERNLSLAMEDYLARAAVPRVGQTGSEKAAAIYQLCIEQKRPGEEKRGLFHLLRRFKVGLFRDSEQQPLEAFVQLFLRVHLFLVFRFQLAVDPETRSRFLMFMRSDEFLGWRKMRQQLMEGGKYEDYVRGTVGWITKPSDEQVQQVIGAESEVYSLSEVQHPDQKQKVNVPLAQFGFWRNDSGFSDEWVRLLKSNSFAALPGNLTVTAERGDVEFFHDLFGNDDKINVTTLRTYISWTVLNQVILTTGLAANRTEDDCKRVIMKFFPYSAPSAVLFPVINETRIEHVKTVSSSVSQEILRSFNETSWWDASTRDVALGKLEKMRMYYAYPPGLSDPRGLDAFYEKYPDMRDFFFESYMDASYVYAAYYTYLMTRRSAEDLTVEDTFYQTHRADTRYLTTSNALYLFAGLMYRPVYVYGGPPEVNYGGLGRLIAAGIMRGFDEDGRKVDDAGRSVGWWTNKSDEAYLRHLNCARDSYKKAQGGGSGQSESYVADMMAERSVYNAYRGANETEKVTVGDVGGLTSDQLFYVSWCLMFCGASSEGGQDGGRRCNVPLMNSDGFAEAFSCPVDSFMNPKNKCQFW